ncbi:MAG: DUF4159 domain-containing protein [Planctomycetes bacterium]|nr:DUF4159 domain-containing protein [Planctomycetota bacterium]
MSAPVARPRRRNPARRLRLTAPPHPASLWVCITGLLCLAAAAVLLPSALATSLTPFMGKGPALAAKPPVLVRVLGISVFAVQCVPSLLLGLSGFLILLRVRRPHAAWQTRPGDPPWVERWIERHNRLSREALSIAGRGTYLAVLLCLLGRVTMVAGELLRLPFEVEPDSMVAYYAYPLTLWIWPVAFLCLANIYQVKRHFLPEEAHVESMIRPNDIIDLMHERDVAPARLDRDAAEEKGFSLRRTLSFWWKRIYQFCQVRTCYLRHRTVDIGQTDVHSRWWSQQALRGYRWGPDHRFSESNAWSFAVHAGVIFGPIVLAFILGLFGCLQPYKLPFGGGDRPMGTKQQQKKITKVKKIKKKYLVNPYSSVVFATIKPDMMDLKLEEDTLHPWTGVGGGGGGGRGGGQGGAGLPGYGGGVGGGVVRFIRIQHNGPDWDRNMKLDGDSLLLAEFHKRTRIPVAAKTESVTIEQLEKFPKKFTPPFIYVTGRKPFGVDSREARILQEYLLKRGGLIFGDSPGESFQGSFRGMVSRVLGSRAQWVDIPDDDEIYTCYYMLDRGAPPLWHHDGNRALGVKHQGRWIVFYHPGDLGDAWKVGHSGASPESVEAAYQMGCNVMHYSFIKYIAFHRGEN